jgi:hypothetical protein
LLDAADRGLGRLLRPLHLPDVGVGKLVLELVAGEIVDGLTHVLGTAVHSVDHAGDHECELDLCRIRLGRIAIAIAQVTRCHSGEDFSALFSSSQKTILHFGCETGVKEATILALPRLSRGYSNRAAVSIRQGKIMPFRLSFGVLLSGFTSLVVLWAPAPAQAITAELARKCSALTAKQFPSREPGNPAAGSTKGSGRDQQAFFNKCVGNNGKVDDSDPK